MPMPRYRPGYGQSSMDNAAPFELVSEGEQLAPDAGSDADSAESVVDNTTGGGHLATEGNGGTAVANGNGTNVAANGNGTTTAGPGGPLAQAQAEAKKWKRRFWLAMGIGAVTTIGAGIGGYFIGRASGRGMAGLDMGVGPEGLEQLEDFDAPAPPRRKGKRS